MPMRQGRVTGDQSLGEAGNQLSPSTVASGRFAACSRDERTAGVGRKLQFSSLFSLPQRRHFLSRLKPRREGTRAASPARVATSL